MKTEMFPVGRVKVELIVEDDRVLIRDKAKSRFEPQTREWWGEHANKGTVIDVGAYAGLYAISAALLGATDVVALEPLLEQGSRCLKNAELNKVHVRLLRAAASNRKGFAEITFNSTPLTAGASLSPIHPGTKLQVDCVRLDDLDVKDVTVIKMDVERHEPYVIKGAKQLLFKWRPLLIVECLDGDAILNRVMDELDGVYRVAKHLDRNVLLEPL